MFIDDDDVRWWWIWYMMRKRMKIVYNNRWWPNGHFCNAITITSLHMLAPNTCSFLLCQQMPQVQSSHSLIQILTRMCDKVFFVCVPEDIQPDQKGKGGPLLIHFDGWTARYDYWAEEDSDDLHPIGYMDEVGHKDRTNRSDLQAPKGMLSVWLMLLSLLIRLEDRVVTSYWLQGQDKQKWPSAPRKVSCQYRWCCFLCSFG